MTGSRDIDAAQLSQMLGPAEEELTCEQCFQEIDRYVELELAGAAADSAVPGLGPHLQGCPACREDHDSLLAYLTRDPG